MISIILLIISCLLPMNLSLRYATDPTTQISQGTIVGMNLVSRKGKTFSAFLGIPYAKPPIGDLRFKDPQEANKWDGVFLARKDAPKCAQKNYLFGDMRVEGSEDCLYLNIYTPITKFQSPKKKLYPVMVFIHWGGFFAGYGGRDYLGPKYLMDKDIVLVTFNYRLGIFGFFSTYDDAAPGNFGLKDQLLVLNWIQKNIESFGGDKKRVTIFGQSAGAASVHYHMLGTRSEGLFQKAISQSGTALALWAQPTKDTQLPILQAKIVGCGDKTGNSTSLVECLRKVDANTLLNSGDLFKFFSIDPLNVYLPTIEKKTASNPKPFLTKHPNEYMRTGNFMKVPWIVGIVSDEGLIRASALWSQAELRAKLNSSFNELMPKMLALSMSVPVNQIVSVWKKIKNFYFEDTDHEFVQGLINLYTDRYFHYSTYQSILLHSMKLHKPIWFYKFSYQGEYTYKTLFSGENDSVSTYPHSASHCDDLLYLFESPALFPKIKDANDYIMMSTMIELWTNFAETGNPTPNKGLSNRLPKWNPLLNWKSTVYGNLEKDFIFLHINGSCCNITPPSFQMETGIYNERIKFWEDLPLLENIELLGEKHQDI